jgi:hypothetical protein
MAYDHYKQRLGRRPEAGEPQDPQAQQQQQPADPRLELCRRYRNRVPAI